MSGVYSRTWYDDTCVSLSGQSSEQIRNKNFEFCIIGGGLAGLSCAYHLAKMGSSVRKVCDRCWGLWAKWRILLSWLGCKYITNQQNDR